MKLTLLGTRNALATECYNTCFVIEDDGKCLMVDGGGGSTILRQIKHAGYGWMDMRHIFVTHRHVDYFLGIVWMVRMICQSMNHCEYEDEAFTWRRWSCGVPSRGVALPAGLPVACLVVNPLH